MSQVTFKIIVEFERTEGKSMPNAEVIDEIQTALEDANPGSVEVDESSYDIMDWNVLVTK